MKRSSILLVLFLSGWFLTGCDEEKCECRIMNTGIEVAIQDAAGKNLLDPSTNGYFAKQDIKMFYEIKGKLRTHASLAPGAQLDNPEGFSIGSNGTQYFLNISSNPTPGKEVITILKIKDQADVRLITTVNGDGGSRIEKIWYKDQLVWSVDMQTFPRVTVVLD